MHLEALESSENCEHTVTLMQTPMQGNSAVRLRCFFRKKIQEPNPVIWYRVSRGCAVLSNGMRPRSSALPYWSRELYGVRLGSLECRPTLDKSAAQPVAAGSNSVFESPRLIGQPWYLPLCTLICRWQVAG